jgi:hypothetical protein
MIDLKNTLQKFQESSCGFGSLFEDHLIISIPGLLKAFKISSQWPCT